MRQTCIDLLFSQTPLFVSPEEFAKSLDGWELEPILRGDGSVWVVFVVKGPEFHFAKFGEDPARMAELRKYPGELIARYGYALTKTPKSATRQQRFNERLGFYRVGEEDDYILYRIDHLRKKESICQ